MDGGFDIRALAELIKGENEEESSDDDLPRTSYSSLGPGDIGKKTKLRIRGNTRDDEEKDNSLQVEEDPKSIWKLSEVPEVPFSDDASMDPRDKPEYDIKYKQYVTSQDIYLQMGNKTPTTASCEAMVISMFLKGDRQGDVDCHLGTMHLDIRSPRYRLSLPLPHPVDPDTSTAEWVTAESRLILTLTLNRELDFVNL
ncbi:hypothetical protein AAG570_001898 [Ranatra chinensis]|uniref:PIH1D1/2/3 CS-like domain-containing protein n=1 Tax=Ranatra chinensis TaxID=642074 RepID=A0ABD0Y9X3_9HEMI